MGRVFEYIRQRRKALGKLKLDVLEYTISIELTSCNIDPMNSPCSQHYSLFLLIQDLFAGS